jgi:oligopeptide/dipeptide ABC transporter ATP-binding protein
VGSLSQILTENSGREKLLQVRNLIISFKKTQGVLVKTESLVRAVDDVSFDINNGEVLSLVGESGSGKTTVAKCIMKLISPTSGSITFDGKEITHLKGKDLLEYRKKVQVVYQDPYESIIPRLSVLETMALPIRYLLGERNPRRIRDRAIHLLEEVGLNPSIVLQKYPHQLSGGERQRVNLARALASDPQMLIADEPITMLDAAMRFNVLQLLHSLRLKRNLTVLLITHDLVSAKIISDRTIVMYSGRIVEAGSTESILTKPLHPYVGVIRDATPALRSIAGEESDEFDLFSTIEESAKITQGCNYRPRCKFATSICSEKVPLLEEKSANHSAACHNPLNVGVKLASV